MNGSYRFAQPPAHGSMYLLTLPLIAVLRVAEQVVDRCEPRRDVVPVRLIRHVVAAERRREPAGSRQPPWLLALKCIVADARADGQPLERPGVLRVNPRSSFTYSKYASACCRP